MTPRSFQRSLSGVWIAAALVTAAALGAPAVHRLRSSDVGRKSGPADTVVASIRAEPRSFNRYTSRDLSTVVLTYLTHGSLVRVNRNTNELEPELAERWELLADQQTYRLWLRPNLRFSDGVPFSADDVDFSFKAIYDRRVDSVLADSLRVRGQPLAVTAENAHTVTIRFPSRFAAGLRMLDGVPIYPRHRLNHTLKEGSLGSAWGLSTPPSDLAGLGPFVLHRYEPGQRLTFDRNPHFWQRDQGRPRLEHVVLQVVPEQNAELLQLETGSIDLTQGELRPSDVPALKRAAAAGRVAVTDAGIGLDGDLLWFNLTNAKRRDARSRWLQHPDFRRAISHSIDRREFVDTVYFGSAVEADSIVSPGNRLWHTAAPPPSYDLAAASRLLGSLGLVDRNGDGFLKDPEGGAVRFALLTQKGNTSLERGAWVVSDHLARVGVRVDVVTLEVGTLINYVTQGNYDAAYFRLLTTDTDPALNLDFWLSSGSAHVWNPEQHGPPSTWEAELDGLMERVATTLEIEERRTLFAKAQQIMAREVPALCFAFPRLSIALNSRVADATPAPFRPPLLWNPSGLRIQ
jgi:peptide/nickel transport system substrate-binding protein